MNDPTKVAISTPNLIDHIAASTLMNIAVAGFHKACFSDHHMVLCLRKCQGSILPCDKGKLLINTQLCQQLNLKYSLDPETNLR